MSYEHDIKTLLTIGENIVIEFKRAGNGPEHDTYESIEKMGRETTEKATLQITLSTTLQATLQTTLQGTTLKIAQLMLSHPEIKIDEIASTVGLTRDGVNYQIRKLKKLVGLRHRARLASAFPSKWFKYQPTKLHVKDFIVDQCSKELDGQFNKAMFDDGVQRVYQLFLDRAFNNEPMLRVA